MQKKRSEILNQIKKVSHECNRNPDEVLLLAVSKKQPDEKIKTAYEEGQRDFAENYVQELLQKKESLTNYKINWHMIGPLQSNKASKIVGEVRLIHSVDSLKLAKILSEAAKERNITQDILIQINVSGELSKSGIPIDESQSVIGKMQKLDGIKVKGFMTMPPFTDDAENSRDFFRILKKLRDDFKDSGATELSMGTTQDFHVAIQEGATIIRVGEALFGPRN